MVASSVCRARQCGETKKDRAGELEVSTQKDDDAEADAMRIVASVPEIGDFDFYVHRQLDRYISGDLRRDGIWEPFETRVFCCLCRTGDRVADLGANIGWYSVIASKLVGPDGRVFCFEPDNRNYKLLLKNLALLEFAHHVEAHKIALADRQASSLLYLSEDNLGDHRLFDDGTTRETNVVSVSTLDAFFPRNAPSPTLLKSDTQGSEALILHGAKRLFSERWRPTMILEFWPYGLTKAGCDPVGFYSELISLGYSMFEVSEGFHGLVAVNMKRLHARLASDISPQLMGHINLLCVPDNSNRLARVGDLIQSA